MKAYPSYKDSGVPWLEHVPEHWDLKRNKVFFTERKEIVGDRHNEHKLLSLTLKGIIYRDLENAKGKFPADFSTYQTVHPNDFVFCFFDVDETPRTVGLSTLSGMITGAYTVLSTKGVNPKYLYYYYLCIDNRKGLRPLYKGLRKTVPFDAFMASKLPIPTEDEQQQISRYLDWQTSKINKFIKAKKKLIALLKEQKQNVINEAVTKGVNPDVEMKGSGVEWLGEIPKHWDVRRCKYILREINVRSVDGSEEHLSMSQKHGGLVGREEITERRLMSENYAGGKICNKGDIVLNRLKAHLGVFAVAPRTGVISPDYTVLNVMKITSPEFIECVLKSSKLRPELRVRCKGIVEGFWRLYTDDLFTLSLPLPPKEEQNEIMMAIARRSSKIDQTISKAEREIELIQEYRTRLVSDVVTGKVDVRSVEIPDFEPVEAELEAQDDEESEDELITEGIEE